MSWFSPNKSATVFTESPKTYEPLPAGTYPVYIDECKVRQWDDGTESINVKLVVNSGDEHHKRVIYDSISLESSSDYVKENSIAKLSQLCYLINKGKELHGPSDLYVFIGGEVKAVVTQYKKKTTGEIKNSVKAYLPLVDEEVVAEEEEDVDQAWVDEQRQAPPKAPVRAAPTTAPAAAPTVKPISVVRSKR